MLRRSSLQRSVSSFVGLSLVLPFLSGCGGGGGGSDAADSEAGLGLLNISLVDAPSEEVDRFEVDVTGIELVRRNGARVQALPLAARVDFADLVEVAELLTVASVPFGAYSEVRMTLDFASASVHIVGEDEDAALLDEAGEPLNGSETIAIDFSKGRPLVIAPGLSRFLVLDFVLDASLEVEAGANQVRVLPTFQAEVDLEKAHIHRVRGPLLAVDPALGFYRVDLRPFRAAESRLGEARVYIDGDTVFEIDGVGYTGEAGLAALDGLPALTATLARGEFQSASRRFLASEVYAGSSVSGGSLDVVRGLVKARSGDTLTVIGVEIERSAGALTRNAEVTVVLDTATQVRREGEAAEAGGAAISVGQRILAFGDLEGSPGSFALAPASFVRLLRTEVTGSVTEVRSGGLVLDVHRIGLRTPSSLDFSGTGSGLGGDAAPGAYEIDTGNLILSSFEVGSPVRVLGFVGAFGSAPPDFEAVSLVDLGDVVAFLDVRWEDATVPAFSSIGTGSLELDLTDSPEVHRVLRVGAVTLLDLFDSVTLVPRDSSGFYAIREGRTVTVFRAFDEFALGIQSRISAGKEVRKLSAIGRFEDATGRFSAGVAGVSIR